MNLTDSIDAHIEATPKVCERVIVVLRRYVNGTTRSILSSDTGLSRVLVDSAIEQMEKRGAVSHDGPRWFARST